MKALSEATLKLFLMLNRKETLTERLFSKELNAKKVNVIREIGNAKEPAAVPGLLRHLLDSNEAVGRETARALESLTGDLSASDLVTMDEMVRHNHYFDYCMHWDLREDILDSFIEYPENITILGLFSFHPNGFSRQKALGRLSKFRNGREIPYMLLRLNDWVPEIQAAARQFLTDRIRLDYTEHFVKYMDHILRLADCKRVDHHPFIASVFNLLRETDHGKPILDGLNSGNRLIRRACFRMALEIAGIDHEDILRKALKDKDVSIQHWAAKELRAAFDREKYESLLNEMTTHRFMPIRREALRTIAEKCPELLVERSQKSLLDSHISIRWTARYYLEQGRKFDFESFYLGKVKTTDDRQLYAAICGLGETGSEQNVKDILPFLSHSLSRIRKASIQSIDRLVSTQSPELFFRYLEDISPSVSRVARNALIKRIAVVDAERLWGIFLRHSSLLTKNRTLSIFIHMQKWDSVYFLLRVFQLNDQKLNEWTNVYLEKWIFEENRSFIEPRKDQISRITNELNKHESLIISRIENNLHSVLKRYPL